MEQQLPAALQVALYVASFAIVVLVLVLVGALFQARKQLERLVAAAEELKDEVKPLAQETRVVVEKLRDLSGRAQERWLEVEGIIDTARHWSERANHLVDEIGAAVEPPVFAATRSIRRLRRGVEMFVQVLLNPSQQHQRRGNHE